MHYHFRIILVRLANHSSRGTFRLYVFPLAKIGETKKSKDYRTAGIGMQMTIEAYRINGLMLEDGMEYSDIPYFTYDKIVLQI